MLKSIISDASTYIPILNQAKIAFISTVTWADRFNLIVVWLNWQHGEKAGVIVSSMMKGILSIELNPSFILLGLFHLKQNSKDCFDNETKNETIMNA